MRNNIGKRSASNCCGCGLCSFVCPVKAISMVEDKRCFFIPVVNKHKCINCGLCKTNCPMSASEVLLKEKKYGFYQASEKKEQKCASGGAFYDIALRAIENGYKICGASLVKDNGDFLCKHVFVYSTKDIIKIIGTKYIQSDLNSIYVEINHLLKNDEKVLFVGTPCQVAAIKNLSKKYNSINLITVDLFCFGVPSKSIFNTYLKQLENKANRKVTSVCFRHKMEKKEGTYLVIELEAGETLIEPAQFSHKQMFGFMKAFASSHLCRDCCHDCVFKNKKRIGDISLGDVPISFYEENKEFLKQHFDVGRGISAVGIGEKNFNLINPIFSPLFDFSGYYVPAFCAGKKPTKRSIKKTEKELLGGN